MIKNVIFDIGNVLMKFDALNYGATYFKDKRMAAILQNAINEYGFWDRCDLGNRDVHELIQEFAQTVTGYEDLAKEAIYASLDYVLYADYAIPWIEELHRAGYKVYFLSNYNKYLREKKPEIIDFLPYMDGGVFSCDIHQLKPHREIYETLLANYNLKAEECIFLDDREANIKGAEAVGMEGILVKSYEQAYADLKTTLGY